MKSSLLAASGVLSTISFLKPCGAISIFVEIADSDDKRAIGLMNREALPDNGGMFFVFPETVQEPFWMKNTKISLDIIFISEEMKVVHIIEKAVAGSTELLPSPVPYRYVVEIKGGNAAKFDIKVGDKVEKKLGLH